MKNLPAVILITIIVNVLCWLMLDAWDKEEALRMERQQHTRSIHVSQAVNHLPLVSLSRCGVTSLITSGTHGMEQFTRLFVWF